MIGTAFIIAGLVMIGYDGVWCKLKERRIKLLYLPGTWFVLFGLLLWLF